MCGADCWTDHRLVVSKLNLRIQPARRPQGKKAPKRLDVSKLNKDSMRQDFLTDICNQLEAMNLSSEDPEENWTVFHKTVFSSAASTLGHPSRKHQDWFDENDDEIQRLLEEKHRLLKPHQDDTSSLSKKAAYSNICKTVQTKLRDMQDSWLRKKTEEIQSFADRKDMKKFHDALKTIYGPKSSGATTLLSADGNTLLTDKEAILERWAEHFNSVLNRPSSINQDAIDRLPQIECNVMLDEFPTVTETRKAVQQLSSGKAPGADAIPAEVYKAGGLPMAEKLTELFHCMWRKEAIPQEFKDASIIHLYKRKGNPQVCDNHRGISLLSIARKILAKILLNRLNAHLDQMGLFPESQCGFRKDRGTIDMIFTARKLQEKCQEQNVDLYMTFVDLGTSNIKYISPDYIGEKEFEVSKVTKYTLDETKTFVEELSNKEVYDSFILHSLCNDISRKSPEECSEQMKGILSIISKKYKEVKVIVSLGLPRSDNNLNCRIEKKMCSSKN